MAGRKLGSSFRVFAWAVYTEWVRVVLTERIYSCASSFLGRQRNALRQWESELLGYSAWSWKEAREKVFQGYALQAEIFNMAEERERKMACLGMGHARRKGK